VAASEAVAMSPVCNSVYCSQGAGGGCCRGHSAAAATHAARLPRSTASL